MIQIDVIRVGVIQIDVIRVGVEVIQIYVIQNYRISMPNFFNFNIIIALRIFENAVASRVLTFTFPCAMPQLTPVGKIICSYVEDVEAPGVYL